MIWTFDGKIIMKMKFSASVDVRSNEMHLAHEQEIRNNMKYIFFHSFFYNPNIGYTD